MNSSNSFILEHEEMKSCRYCVDSANGGWSWHHLLVVFLEESALFTSQKHSKHNLWWEFAIIIQCLSRRLAGCKLISAIVWAGRVWTWFERTEPRNRYLSKRIQIIIYWIPTSFISFQQNQDCEVKLKNFVSPIQWIQWNFLEEIKRKAPVLVVQELPALNSSQTLVCSCLWKCQLDLVRYLLEKY